MVFVTGATGYMGSRLVGRLAQEGASVRALVRRPVALPCSVVAGDPLNAASYGEAVRGCDAFVHLVGTPHPAPGRGRSSALSIWFQFGKRLRRRNPPG